jgi:hypothetical protein
MYVACMAEAGEMHVLFLKIEGKSLFARAGLGWGVGLMLKMDHNGVVQEGVNWSHLVEDVIMVGSCEV